MAHVAWGRGGLREEGLFGMSYVEKDVGDMSDRVAVKRSVQRNRDQRCRKRLLVAQSKSGGGSDPRALGAEEESGSGPEPADSLEESN